MTEVLRSPSQFPSTSSSSSSCARLNPNDGSHPNVLINSPTIDEEIQDHLSTEEFEEEEEEEGGETRDRKRKERDREGDQLSVLTFFLLLENL